MTLPKLFCTVCNDTILSKNMARHRKAKYHIYMKKKNSVNITGTKNLKVIRASKAEIEWCFKNEAKDFLYSLLQERGYRFAE